MATQVGETDLIHAVQDVLTVATQAAENQQESRSARYKSGVEPPHSKQELQMLINEERRHLYRVLDDTMLPTGVAEKLAGLGITTLDELRDHWIYGNRQLITAYLGDSPLRLVTGSLSSMRTMRGPGGGSGPVVNLLEAGRARPFVRHPRGVILSEGQSPSPNGAKVEATKFLWTVARPVAAKKVAVTGTSALVMPN